MTKQRLSIQELNKLLAETIEVGRRFFSSTSRIGPLERNIFSTTPPTVYAEPEIVDEIDLTDEPTIKQESIDIEDVESEELESDSSSSFVADLRDCKVEIERLPQNVMERYVKKEKVVGPVRRGKRPRKDNVLNLTRFPCVICPKVLSSLLSLNEHLNLHTNERPYECNYCDQTFTHLVSLNRHEKTHRRK